MEACPFPPVRGGAGVGLGDSLRPCGIKSEPAPFHLSFTEKPEDVRIRVLNVLCKQTGFFKEGGLTQRTQLSALFCMYRKGLLMREAKYVQYNLTRG